MFVRFSRLIAVAMGAVICFGLIVPLALKRGDTWIAIGVSVLFAAYAIVNIVLWRRFQNR